MGGTVGEVDGVGPQEGGGVGILELIARRWSGAGSGADGVPVAAGEGGVYGKVVS